MKGHNTRRDFLLASAAVGAGLVLTSCAGGNTARTNQQAKTGSPVKPDAGEQGGEVTATEDLMREHGVLRRALLVYTAAAGKLRANASSVPPDALQKTAKLFRAFGEEYHEKKLEEQFIFPAVRKAGETATALPDILVVQHGRGSRAGRRSAATPRSWRRRWKHSCSCTSTTRPARTPSSSRRGSGR
jgi:hypothetical protein